MKVVENKDRKLTNRTYVMLAAIACAFGAAAGYILIGLNYLAVGDLATSEEPPAIIFVAAACYTAGGLLILLSRRWLWIVGAAMNALVILIFAMAYIERPSVMFSPGGLTTKIMQLALELCLLYLIVTVHQREHSHVG